LIALIVGVVPNAGAQVTGCDPNLQSSNLVCRVGGTAANLYVSIPLPASSAYFHADIATGLPSATNSLAIDPDYLTRVCFIRGFGVDAGKLKCWDLPSQGKFASDFSPMASSRPDRAVAATARCRF
jgi:hypothetical protein